MFWEAITEDGKVHKQILGEQFKNLDATKITELMLRDQPSAHSIPMDLNENLLKMPNFNQMMLEITPEVPDIHLTYDRAQQAYRFDERSLKFLKDAIIPYRDFYSSFGVSNGKFLMDEFDIQYQFLIKLDGEYKNIFDFKPVSSELRYCYNAHSEFKVGMSVQKGSTMTDSVQVVQTNKYLIDDVLYELESKLKFSFSSRLLQLFIEFDSKNHKTEFKINFRTKDQIHSLENVRSNAPKYHDFYLGTLEY